LLEIFERLESIDLAVHPQRCAVVRNRNSTCQKCADACTSGAIILEGNEIAVTKDCCIGCGTCATVCPTAALEALNPTDNDLLRTAVNILREQGTEPVFACRPLLAANKHGYDRSKVVEVTCLGRIEEAELVALLALGIPSITLASGDCALCENAKGAQTIELIQTTLSTLLNAWGSTSTVSLQNGLPSPVALKQRSGRSIDAAGGLSRREFFKQLKGGAQTAIVDVVDAQGVFTEPSRESVIRQAAGHGVGHGRGAGAGYGGGAGAGYGGGAGAGYGGGAGAGADYGGTGQSVIRVMKDGTLPHFIPNRRERLLDHLDALGTPQATSINTRLWGHIEIDETRCNSCKMCATFCPTGAISRFEDTDGTAGIEHYPADCVQCRLCEDICLPKALSVSSDVPLNELVTGEIIRYEMSTVPIAELPNEKKALHAIQSKLGDVPVYEHG
jgi:Fe-S-cluster-containing hydrogenase component 2